MNDTLRAHQKRVKEQNYTSHRWLPKCVGRNYTECSRCGVRGHWPGAWERCQVQSLSPFERAQKAKEARASKAPRAPKSPWKSTRRVEWRGEQYTPHQLSKLTGVPVSSIYDRMRLGKPVDDDYVAAYMRRKELRDGKKND